MKIRIVNETGRGQDTKVFIICENDGALKYDMRPGRVFWEDKIDISECFSNSVIEVPTDGEVSAILEVDRAKLDLLFERGRVKFKKKEKEK